jgi:hypothetical protein
VADSKTFIQLINDVGKNLRLSDGTTFTTVTQDQDVVFIAQAINLAKDMVEGERQWNTMWDEITFSSVVSTPTYDLSDLAVVSSDPVVASNRSQLVIGPEGAPEFWDVTGEDEQRMQRKHRTWVRRRRALDGDTVQDTKPFWFAIYRQGDGLTVEFPYDVQNVRDYLMLLYTPQDELVATTTTVEAPWRPIIAAATAIAAEERGEELGLDASTWWGRYTDQLAQAIFIDHQGDADSTLVAV